MNKKNFLIKWYYHPEISYNDYSLELYVDKINICEFMINDKIEKTYDDLYFIVEWFEENLEFITNIDEFPFKVKGNSGVEILDNSYLIDWDINKNEKELNKQWKWNSRHNLRSIGPKGFYPYVVFRRKNNKIEVSWENKDLFKEYGVVFINQKGVSFVEIKEFEEEVIRFIKDVRKVGETVRLKLMIPYIGETKLIYAEKEYNEPFSFEKEMLEDLERCGYITDSVYNLILMNENDRKLVPIIIKYIKLSFHDEEKIQLTRFLAVEGFIEAIRPLLDEFYKTKNKEYRTVICNTISIISNENLSEELIEIIKKREYGTSRKPLVYRLYKYKNREKVIEVLQNLLKDEDLKEYAEYSFNNLSGYKSKIYKCSIQ